MPADRFTTAATYIEPFQGVLATLSSNGCVADFQITGTEVTVEWSDSGFDRALEEAKASSSPFGMTGKQCVHLVLLLWQCRKDRVTPDLLVPAMNERMKEHPNRSFMDIFFRKGK